MKKLTQSEEQIMSALWTFNKGGFIKDVLEALEEPKPHHNTIATLLKILVEKQFVGIKNPNRNNFYYPLVSKDEYSTQSIEGLTDRYFVSFLVDKKQMSIQELELLLKQLKKKKNG